MKKYLALLLATALIISFAACGDSGKKEDTAPQQTAVSTEETLTGETDDPDDIAAQGAKLIGTWSAEDWPPVKLIFNEDGTGSFTRQDESSCSFTYSQYDYHIFNSGDEYMIKVDYETGESEDIIFWYSEDGRLCFHNSDHGGYGGVMSFSSWKKAE